MEPSDHALFRPPSEARSLVLRVADGCPWNRCTFCGMYKNVRYREHSLRDVQDELAPGECHKIELIVTLEFANDSVDFRTLAEAGDVDLATWWIEVTDMDNLISEPCR